ncbi:uncharacterized protein LOC144769745 [Lissotriton helveticus]
MENEEGYTTLQLKGRRNPENEEGYSALQCKRSRKPEEEGYTALQLKERRKPEDEKGYTARQLKGRKKPEDVEGYTALQLKGRKKPEDVEGYTALRFQGRRKPDDEEGYSALQLKGRRKPEDEEGYTALQFQGRRKPEDEEGYTALQLKGRKTTEDEAGYTDLNFQGRRKPEEEEGYTAGQFKGKRKPEDRCEDVLRADAQDPRFQRPALWIIVSLSVLLVLAVTGSGIWIFNLHQEIGVLKMNQKQRDDCNCTNTSAGAHPTPCCPLYWEQRGRKCYYFPEKTAVKNWRESHEDCSSRGSRLVVIEDKDELVYLTSKLSNYVWIGLFKTPAGRHWTWVNGSALNEAM